MAGSETHVSLPAPTVENIILLALAVLAAIFLAAFFILICICRRIRSAKKSSQLLKDSTSDCHASSTSLGPGPETLVPHCVAVLRACHALTRPLACAAALRDQKYGSSSNAAGLAQVEQVAKKISPKVDDLVRALYPPLDARVLEARTAALTLAVSNLALVAGGQADKAIKDMEPHLQVLREAALTQEAAMQCLQDSNQSYSFL